MASRAIFIAIYTPSRQFSTPRYGNALFLVNEAGAGRDCVNGLVIKK